MKATLLTQHLKATAIVLLCFSIFANSVYGQASGYGFTATTGTYADLSSGSTSTSLSATTDDGLSSTVALPFTFNFAGTDYTGCKVSSNGWLTFNTGLFSSYNSNGSGNASSAGPILAPLWDDLQNINFAPRYRTDGTAPNRIFKVEWQSEWRYLSGDAVMSYQIVLYENGDQIDFIYQQEPDPVSSGSATIGIHDDADTYLTLNNSGSSPAASSSTFTTNISTKPATGQVYRWTPPTCFAPGIASVTSTTSSTVDFSWTAASTAPGVGYEYIVQSPLVPDPTAGSSGTAESGLSATVGGLAAATNYEIWVRSDCGSGDVTAWVGPVAFTTDCNALTVPWTDDIESVTTVGSTSFPVCWSKQNGDWRSADAADNTYNDPRSGNRYLVNQWTATSEYMWTPGLALTAGTSYDFKFWFAGDGNSGWTGTVFVNDAQSSTGGTGASQLGGGFVSSGDSPNNTYEEVSRTFVPTTTGTYYFAVRHSASSAPWYIGFDDFSVTETPNCLPATALSVTPTAPTMADVTWTGAGDYIVEYGAAGFTPGTGASNGTGGTIASSTANTPYSITFPSATTEYDVYVRQACTSPTAYSPNAGAVSFLPGDVCANAIDLGALTSPYNGTTVGAGSDYSISCASGSAPDLVFSIDVADGETFNITNTTPSYDSKIAMFYGGACPGTTQIACWDDPDNQTNSWTNTTGSTQTVYWVQDGYSSNSGTFTLDWDVVACGSEPTALNSSAVAQTTATIGWTAAAIPPASYDYHLNTTGTLPVGPSVTNVPSGTSAGLTGLTAATTYYYWVRSNCGGDVSGWVGPESFTTPCATFTVPWTDDIESVVTVGTTSFPDCWLKQNGGWESADAADNSYHDPRSGNRYLINNWTATSEYMWTPGVALTAGTGYDFKFWFAGDGNSGWTGTVFVNDAQSSTGGSGASQIGGAFISSSTVSTSTYQEVTRTFIPTTTGTYYFAVRHSASSAPWYLGFDDFSVTEAPPCSAPVATLTVTSTNTADITWAGSGTYLVEYGPAGYTPGTGAATSGTGTIASSSASSPYTITFPSATTEYDVYVREDCSVPDFSANSAAVNFLPGDVCANAIDLGALTSPYSGTTTGASNSITTVGSGCYNNSAPELVFSIDVSDGETLTIGQTSNSYDSYNYLFYGGSCPGTTEIDCYDSDLVENTWANTTGSTQTVYFVQDGWSTNSGTFTLDWDVVACGSEPTALNSSAVAQTTATIGWTAAAAPPSSYDYFVSTSNTLPGSPSVTNVPSGTSAGLTGLTAATTYYYWVRSNCGGDVSDWVGPESFTTECAAFTVPWTDDYESVTTIGTNNHPVCWFEQNGGWESADAADNSYNDPRSGDRYLLNNWTATSEYMWTPGVALTAGTSYDFKFWFAGDGNSGWTGTVFVNDAQSSTGGSGASQIGGAFISSSTVSTSTYQEVTRTFIPTTTGTYYFAVRHSASSAPWYIGFDDFSVTETPDCLSATALSVTPTAPTMADVTWTGAGDYIVEYGAAGFTPGTGASNGTGGTIASSTANTPYSITFPSATTEYDVYVRQVCAGPVYSPNQGPSNFLPGDVCANAIDLGALTSPYSGTTVGAGSDYSISCASGSAPDLVFSIDVADGETFNITNTTPSYDSKIAMFYGGACPGTTQIACWDDPDNQTNSWTNTTGSTQTVYWVQDGYSSNSGTFTLDWDVVACGSQPTALNSSAVAQTTATIGWTAAAAPPSSYDYFVSTSNTLPGSPSVTNVPSGTSAGLTGLTAATTYYYWVRSNCGGDVSDWVGPESFTTECPAFTVPWTDDIESVTTLGPTNFPVCWSKQNGGWESADAADNSYHDPRSGNRYLINNWTATSEYMWTPGVALTAGTGYDFKFWFAGDGNSGWTGTVFVNDAQSSTGGSGASQIGGAFISSSTVSTSTYQEVTRTFIPTTTGTYYFAVRHSASSAPWYLGFDDFSVTETPLCGQPFDYVFSGSNTDPTVSWTEPVPPASNGYQYIVQNAATPVPGPTATPDGTTAFGDSDFDLLGLTVGSTYYIWVRSDCTTEFGDWAPVTYTVPLPNDDCLDAINLPCASGVVSGTTNGAVAETVTWGCFSESDYGVWYSFTGDGQITTIDVTGLAGFDLSLNVMSGSCGSFSQVACEDATTGTETATFTTVPGEDYFVYISHWNWFGSTTGDFVIERTCVPAPPPPVNDECANAITLNCGDALIGTNEDATTIGQPTGFCGTSPGGPGVWYTFEGTGFNATVATCGSNGTLGDTKMNVYTGSCGTLVCEDGSDDGCGSRSSVTISPTVAGETYYVLVTGFSGAEGSFDISLDCDVDVWTGTVSTDWSVAGNWSSLSVPGGTDNALIPANPSGNNFPEVFGDYSVGLLRVANGAEMSIEDGGAITAAFFADVEGDLNVANNGSFVQAGGSVLAGSGTFHVTKNGSANYDYWSSPITNFTGGFVVGSYVYDPALGTDDPSDDEYDPGWVLAGGSMVPGKGYARQNGLTQTFSGTANNGTVTTFVDQNGLPNVSWNLIGNPYPSGISVASFLSANSGILDIPAVYLWDDPGTQPYGVGDYAVRNAAGGTAGGGGNVPGPNIGTAQGFKVKVASDGNIQFTNSMRTSGNSAMLFRQSESKRLWLNVTSTNGFFNQTLVGFFEDGTPGLDIYDAPKLNWMSDLSLYSILNSEPYSIQGYGPFYQEAVFPLGLHLGMQQEVTFEIDHVDGLENNYIYLEDTYLGVYHDLNAGSYVFTADQGIYNDRFFVHFMPQSVTDIENLESTSFGAILIDDMLSVSSMNDLYGMVEVLDMSGRVVLSRDNVSLNSGGTRFDMTNVSDGVYIVRFVGAEGALSKKVLK